MRFSQRIISKSDIPVSPNILTFSLFGDNFFSGKKRGVSDNFVLISSCTSCTDATQFRFQWTWFLYRRACYCIDTHKLLLRRPLTGERPSCTCTLSMTH